jgi:hypothetical protein
VGEYITSSPTCLAVCLSGSLTVYSSVCCVSVPVESARLPWFCVPSSDCSGIQPTRPINRSITRVHHQSHQPALTSTTDHRMLQDWRLCGHVGARSPSGLHGVWGALITDNGSHHDLAIITGGTPARCGENDEVLLISARHSKSPTSTLSKVTMAVEGREMSWAMTKLPLLLL